MCKLCVGKQNCVGAADIAHPIFNRVEGASKKKKDYVESILKDQSFWKAIKETQDVLKPISKIIALLESNNSHLSQVYECFKQLLMIGKIKMT
jgi:hypothetical protein